MNYEVATMNIKVGVLSFWLQSVALLGCLCLATGCSSKGEDLSGVIPEAQLKALDSAKQVEDTLLKHDDALRKQLEQSN